MTIPHHMVGRAGGGGGGGRQGIAGSKCALHFDSNAIAYLCRCSVFRALFLFLVTNHLGGRDLDNAMSRLTAAADK